jgi:hypothetical protein
LHEIYRYYEILGEEQHELHTRWLWRRLWKGIISLSSKSTAILLRTSGAEMALLGGGNYFPGGAIAAEFIAEFHFYIAANIGFVSLNSIFTCISLPSSDW